MNRDHYKIKKLFKRLSVPVMAGDTTAKLFFIILSLCLWFLIKLSKEGYTSEINFPVEYVNIPANKVLRNEPTNNLTVSLRSQGFEILKYKLRSLRPLQIDVSRLTVSDQEHYVWSTDSKSDLINAQFEDDATVVDIQPDTVHFDFSLVKSKKVKVYVRGKRQLSDFKILYAAPTIVPDSITVSGSEAVLENIDSIFTKELTVAGDVDSVNRVVPLVLPKGENLGFSHKKVKVKLLYTSLTEGAFEVPVEIINLPEKYNITLFPDKVNVKFQVPLEDFQKVKENDFQAYVDFKQIEDKTKARFLTIYLKSSPSYIKKATLEPKQLEYILTKK